jgi:hypothetical protein
MDILSMSKSELISELEKFEFDCKGLNKVNLQLALMQQVNVTGAAVIDTLSSGVTKTSQGRLSHGSSMESIHSKAEHKLDMAPTLSAEQFYQLELAKMQNEERDKQRVNELALLELKATAPVPVVPTVPSFRVDAAVKLIPKFNENDIESFLLSFEKIALLNDFPKKKYAAILQAHLTGRALKVFTELSMADCQDYDKLKAALLTAYSVVPEVYTKRFRTTNMNNSETFSDFAFRLSTIFKRWMEGLQALTNLEKMIEVIMLEQFHECIDNDLRNWLIDQKPKSLIEAARLADQYVAVHKQYKLGYRSNNVRDQGQTKDEFSSFVNKP